MRLRAAVAGCALGEIDRLNPVSGGPCEGSLPLCGEAACTAGHICVDGACVRDLCNGFHDHFGCRHTGCPRGSHCVVYPEAPCNPSHCSCDPATGSLLCTTDCGGGACLADGETEFPVPPRLPGDVVIPLPLN